MFRMTSVTAGLILAATVSARAAAPDLATVGRIERAVRLPESSRPLDGYDRYYAPDSISDRQVIVGLYLATEMADERESYKKRHFWNGGRPRKGQLQVLANASMLPDGITDGGCEEIHVYWDVMTSKIAGVFCNGLG